MTKNKKSALLQITFFISYYMIIIIIYYTLSYNFTLISCGLDKCYTTITVNTFFCYPQSGGHCQFDIGNAFCRISLRVLPLGHKQIEFRDEICERSFESISRLSSAVIEKFETHKNPISVRFAIQNVEIIVL